ncbi:hypothetical protein EV209_2119 [Cuneatibacter caecimuris]|uniref:Uncharacterized protein n=1 Tax=Cuneatibacter caecimuris TaxID=1796618 RepID=A0A4V2F5W9_9FIRM|nr:hypothetical protein EV209_2119 [Cuneatibacter caecimuris]
MIANLKKDMPREIYPKDIIKIKNAVQQMISVEPKTIFFIIHSPKSPFANFC